MRIFVLLSRVPYPLEKGDKLRAFNHIKYLSANNEIILCALNIQKIKDRESIYKNLSPYCSQIKIINIGKFRLLLNLLRGIFTNKPFQVELFYSNSINKKVNNFINQSKPEHIFCQLIRVSEYVKSLTIPKTLDYQDVFSKGVSRRINVSNLLMKWILKIEYKKLLRYENMIYDYFDNKIIISSSDRQHIPHNDRDKIHIIPNGIDTDYFRNDKTIAKEYDLLFTGNMGYYPNIVSVMYLAEQIIPEVKKYKPDIKVLISGANPHKKILALESENIHIGGWVEDIRDSYNKSRIFIAPMQIGTGLQNKLLEAMSMRMPCITSELANQALNAQNGMNIIVCNTPKEYAQSILKLLSDDNESKRLAANSYEFVKENFNWKNTITNLENIINSTK